MWGVAGAGQLVWCNWVIAWLVTTIYADLHYWTISLEVSRTKGIEQKKKKKTWRFLFDSYCLIAVSVSVWSHHHVCVWVCVKTNFWDHTTILFVSKCVISNKCYLCVICGRSNKPIWDWGDLHLTKQTSCTANRTAWQTDLQTYVTLVTLETHETLETFETLMTEVLR